MSKRIVVDPVTRIEGHLRVDVEVDGGRVKNAWSSGQMFRGIEEILKGRDPRDAWLFTQRFCGVCTTVHAIASVRTVENALNLDVPMNAQYIRNLIVGAHAMHDHIVHFYHLSALDWVDVVSALKADPAKTSALAESLSPWPHNGTAVLKVGAGPAEGLRRGGAARDLRERLLGPPGDEAAARGEPPRRVALPPGARVPAEDQQSRRAPRLEDAEHPEPRGRRRGERHQPRQRGDAQHEQAVLRQGVPRRGAAVHRAGLLPRRVRRRRALRGLAAVRRRREELPRRPRLPARREGHAVRPPGRDDPERRPRDREGDQELPGRLLQGGGHRVDRPRLVRRRLGEAPVRRGHRPEVRQVGGRREVLVGEGAAVPGQADAGRPARPGPRRARPQARADGAMGRRRPSRRSGPSRRRRSGPRSSTRRSAGTRRG